MDIVVKAVFVGKANTSSLSEVVVHRCSSNKMFLKAS